MTPSIAAAHQRWLPASVVFENGKFAWILDPDRNKVELWEPMPWDEKNKEK